MKTPARLAQLSIQQKIDLIYTILDDLTAELVANYQEVDVEFRCKAKVLRSSTGTDVSTNPR